MNGKPALRRGLPRHFTESPRFTISEKPKPTEKRPMFAIKRLIAGLMTAFAIAAARPNSASAAPPPEQRATQTMATTPTAPSSQSKNFHPLEDPPPNRWKGFEVVPGKDPNGWSFILEPYGWAMGMNGDIGVKGLPPSHVDFSAKDILQHLDWGIFAKGEIRKGRWGLLGDGFFASGDPPGPLYESANLTIEQGLASLALAYRIIDDRRGFLDIYAGARYNYFGINIGTSIDNAGIQQVGNETAQTIASAVDARVQSAVNAEVQKLQAQFGNEDAILQEDTRDRIAAGLESNLQSTLRRDLSSSDALRDAVPAEDVSSISKDLDSEYRDFLNASLDVRLAEARARIDAGQAQARASAQARLAQAEKKLGVNFTRNIFLKQDTGFSIWTVPTMDLAITPVNTVCSPGSA
jgi:hypothetical protein